MKKAVIIMVGILAQGIVSIIALLLVSLLTYYFKWQADSAMLGITLVYILAGLGGGITMRCLSTLWIHRKQDMIKVMEKDVGLAEKMLESILAATIFMLLLLGLSFGIVSEEIALSGRLLLIWMLLIGSTALGRIL